MKAFIRKSLRRILPKQSFVRFAHWWRNRRNAGFNKRIAHHHYHGHHLAIEIADPMSQAWYDHDWVQKLPELDILSQRSLAPGATVFDLGAHHAVVALIMAKKVGQYGRVVAVEAEPWNAKCAEQNRLLNKADNLTIKLAAVTDHPNVESNQSERLNDWILADVPQVTVDHLSEQYGSPDIVYIDVDGFDCHALRGASETLASPADWFVEVHVGCGLEDQGGSWQEVLSFFPEKKYERLIAAEGDDEFIPYSADSPLLSDRFFLLALNRASTPPA